MLGVAVRRILIAVPVLFLVSVVGFCLVLLVPGDPSQTLAGNSPTPERVAEIRERLGLDDPLLTQYGRWVSGMVQGDFGKSLLGGDVGTTIKQRIPPTFFLASMAIVIALLAGIPIGILAALNHGRWTDRILGIGVATSLAMPNYFFGMLLVLVLSIQWGWLPPTTYVPLSSGLWDWFSHLILPAVALSLTGVGVVARQLRSALIGVLSEDYVRTARAKGLRNRVVIVKHALKNATVPVVTTMVGMIGAFIGGAVAVERVFGINGLGTLSVNAVIQGDLPMVQGIVMVIAVFVVAVNFIADLATAYLNPKVRIS